MAGLSNDSMMDIMLLTTKLQNLCEGFDDTNKSAIITSKIKILLAITENGGIASPSTIKNKVGLAKSNVALACSKLITEGYVSKVRDNFDIREITYSITEAGKTYLNDFLTISKKNFEGQLAYKNNMKDIKQATSTLLDLIK